MTSENMNLSQYCVAFLHTIPPFVGYTGWTSRVPPEPEWGSPPGAALGALGSALADDSGRPTTFITLRAPLSTRDRMDEDGPFFEDFRVGTEMRSKVGRTVTETDNVWFTLLTGNGNQIHFNEDYTRRTFPGEPFLGRRVVNGFLTVAIAAGPPPHLTSPKRFPGGLREDPFPPPGCPRGPPLPPAPGPPGPGPPRPPRSAPAPGPTG